MNLANWLGGDRVAALANLRFEFGLTSILLGLVLLCLIGGLVAWRYLKDLKPIKGQVKWAMLAMRVAAWVLVGFLLLDPAWVGEKFDPTQNYVLLLFDDSRSMRIPLRPGESRGQALRTAYEEASAEFETVLSQRYALARYAFGERTYRLDSLGELKFDQRETRLEGSISKALADFQGIQVAAVIVFSDGISQPTAGASESPEWGGVPIMTVGVGDSDRWRDLALSDLRVNRTFGDGRPVRVQVNVQATGLAEKAATLELLEGNRVLTSRALTFTRGEETQNIQLEAVPSEKGWLIYKVRVRLEGQTVDSVGVSPTEEDWVPENNQIRFLVDNREKTFRVFYFSGRPNWEHKFVQRALTEDPQFELVSVLRISAADRKFVYRGKRSSMVNPLFEGFDGALQDQPRYDEAVFLRFGGQAELAGRGYPEDTEELFDYDVVIMGDIEANFYSQTQLAISREFVRKRGGSMLMLGGPYSFTEGGWRGTALEAMLPVMLAQPVGAEERLDNFARPFKVEPTLDGHLSGVWALNANAEQDKLLWQDLPELSGLHGFAMTRVGSTIMARAQTDSPAWEDVPVFASQRYGEGKTAVMATVSTWPWAMATDLEDPRHGQIWRQIVRHLAVDVPKPIQLRFEADSAVEGAPLDMVAFVRDSAFDPKSGARMTLSLRDPNGTSHALPVEEVLDQAGMYRTQWTPVEPGLHQLDLEVLDSEGKPLGKVEEAFWSQADDREFRQAASQPQTLQRLAEAHNGRFFSLNELAKIPDRIPWTKSQSAETVRLPFWHFPGFYVLLVVLWSLEWAFRRLQGQA